MAGSTEKDEEEFHDLKFLKMFANGKEEILGEYISDGMVSDRLLDGSKLDEELASFAHR